MTKLRDAQQRVAQEVFVGMGYMPKAKIAEIVYAGVFEEAGEIAGIHKRQHRLFKQDFARIARDKLEEEIGDLFWYLLALCDVEGMDIQDIYDKNIQKLEDRYGHNQSSESL